MNNVWKPFYSGETAHSDVIKMNVNGCPAIIVDVYLHLVTSSLTSSVKRAPSGTLRRQLAPCSFITFSCPLSHNQ